MTDGKLRLNLGCGDRYVLGWVNIDHDSPHRLDTRVDLTGPLPPEWVGRVSHIYAGHLFEHLTRDQCVHLAGRLLACADPAGCLMMIVGPDMAKARTMADDGTLDTTYHSLDSILHGGRRWPGDDHKWATTGVAVATLMKHDAGWPIVQQHPLEEVDLFWPVADRVPPWQYAVRAYAGTPRPW